MKTTKVFFLLLITALILALLTGCAPKGEGPGEGSVGLANPWQESDQQGVLEATGFSMTAPEGASDVRYSYLAESGLAQMRYDLQGAEWVYRIQPAEALEDISGMAYEWTAQQAGEVAGREAMYYAWLDRSPDSQTVDDTPSVQVVNWYDALTGTTYSLSASGRDLNGMDLQVYAEALYAPLQEETAADPETEQAEELEAYFLGDFIRDNDGSTLRIAQGADAITVDISIFRLCSLENGVGTFAEHKLSFTVDDPNGDPMRGVIYRDSDNSLTLQITDSTWELLPAGEVLDGFRR